MRLYLSADIEGIAGIVGRDQVRAGAFDYDRACELMTDSVLAVCTAAHEAGVHEVVVSDSHGNGRNIQFERMPDYVQLVRSWPRPLGMMQGIESGPFVGAALVGYHAGASNPEGVLSHTLSSDLFTEIRFNESVMSEAAISAAVAGHFGVPVLMIAGDDVFIAETRALLGEVSTATLKTAYGTSSALSPSAGVAETRLREATRAAIGHVGKLGAYRIAGPIDIDLGLRTRSVAEWLAYLPEVRRIDALTVRYRAADIIAASKFLMFAIMGKAALA